MAVNAGIDFTWVNKNGEAVIISSAETDANEVTLTITNQSGGNLTVQQGNPAAYGSMPAGQSAFYLFFNGLIPNADIANIVVTGSPAGNWTSGTFVDANSGQYLVITRQQSNLSWASEQSLVFTLTNLVTQAAENEGAITLGWQNLQTLEDAFAQEIVSVEQGAGGIFKGKRPLTLKQGWLTSRIVFIGNSSAAVKLNVLHLFFGNRRDHPLVPDGADAWDDNNPPEFKLSFTTDSSAEGALTDVANANNIEVNVKEDFGNPWTVEKHTEVSPPFWKLLPGRNPGTILGSGLNASTIFEISNIQTNLTEGVTYARIEHKNIPGFRNGFRIRPIAKVLPVKITTFSASPSSIDLLNNNNLQPGPTTVTISYTVENAQYIEIPQANHEDTVDISTTRQVSGTVTLQVSNTTLVEIVAFNYRTKHQARKVLTIPVSPDNTSGMPKGSIVMWSGSEDQLPTGWKLCKGGSHNGITIPDLRDRFITGSNMSTGNSNGPNINSKGNADQHNHHTTLNKSFDTYHAGTHHHSTTFTYTKAMSSGRSSSYRLLTTGVHLGHSTKGTGNGTNTINTNSEGSHNHSVSVNFGTTYSSTYTGTNRPKWYSLAFIIKIF